MHKMKQQLKNKFTLFEWSGALGDIGILFPLAFAFIIFNGFSPQKLFFLWGLAYVVTGYYYKVPIAVQPLKAMAVIAITSGFLPHQISSTAFFFGILLIVISMTRILKLIQPLFSPPIIRGIQTGIGLILVYKAMTLVAEKGLFLGWQKGNLLVSVGIMALVVALLWYFQFRKKIPLSLFLIFISILVPYLAGVKVSVPPAGTQSLLSIQVPDFSFFIIAMIYLILPQLPLTIGNAVYAANDVCHQLWKDRSGRVNPTKLGFSIGIINIFIGLFGGFPICHGAGGMVAHHQFGGKTGGTTIIIGALLMTVAIIPSAGHFIFYIPIPVLGAMLFITGFKMANFIITLKTKRELAIAFLVAAVSFFTRNLLIAVVCGFLFDQLLKLVTRLTSSYGAVSVTPTDAGKE
jgi:sulfate permease, SulP family